MRIALLYPEVYDMARFREKRKEFPPFGVLYLASVLEEAGHAVVVQKVSPQYTTLDLTSYDAVGFSLSSSATYNMMLAARKNSPFRADALIMVGGVHCNFYPEQSFIDFDAHVASAGEADDTITEILERADSKRFMDIPGLLWRDAGQIRRERPLEVMRNLDHLPLPARHLLPMEDFVLADRLAGTDQRMAHVMFSRGCPFPCNFCAAGNIKIQYRSGSSARKELIHLIDTYQVQGFSIVDDNFIVNKKKVADICDHIGDLGLTWSALSRVDTVDEPLLKKMAASGCIEIKFGMESGSESLLRAMDKRTKQDQIRRAIHGAVNARIHAKVFIIHGFPGENLETTLETMKLLEELGSAISRVSLFRFVPLPGTRVYTEADKYGIRGTHFQPDWDGDWSKFHIHHNERRWWGSDKQWAETEQAYQMLAKFIEARWNAQR